MVKLNFPNSNVRVVLGQMNLLICSVVIPGGNLSFIKVCKKNLAVADNKSVSASSSFCRMLKTFYCVFWGKL